jgi:hypothetical protein
MDKHEATSAQGGDSASGKVPWKAILPSIGVLLAPVTVSIWSMATQSYPALFFIERQALWDNGRYGMKLTFGCTFIYIIAAVVIPLWLLFSVIYRLLPAKDAPPSPGDPSWRELERHRRSPYIAYAMLSAALAALLIYLFVARPEVFTPVPFLGSLGLIGLPIALFAATGLAINSFGRVEVYRGAVDAIEADVDPTGRRPVLHTLKSGGRAFTITAESASQLAIGAEMRIERPPLGGRVVALLVKATTPYRS